MPDIFDNKSGSPVFPSGSNEEGGVTKFQVGNAVGGTPSDRGNQKVGSLGSVANEKATVVSPEASRQTVNPLSSFAVNPRRVSFETQGTDETVILLLRRHVVTNVPWVAATVIAFFAPVFLIPAFSFLGLLSSVSPSMQFVFTIFWYVGVFTFSLISFINWYYNVYIVTNLRLIDVDFVNLTYKEISHAPLFKVQDINFKQIGVVPSIFNFGTVYVQTAGELPNFDFTDVPRPAEVVKIISDLVQEAEEGGNP
jgi:hypothetical protein